MDRPTVSARTLEQTIAEICAAIDRAASGDRHADVAAEAMPTALAPLIRSLNRLLDSARTAIDARERSDARYRALVEEGQAVVYVLDVRSGTVHLTMDPQMEALLGYPRDEWQADIALLQERLHPEDRRRVVDAKVRSAQRGEPLDLEYRIISRYGTTLWVHEHATVECDVDGQPVRLHGIALNITARRRIEEALRESERRFAHVAERLPHVTFHWNADGIQYISPTCLQMFGRSPEELMQCTNPRELLLHPDDLGPTEGQAASLFGPLEFEARVLRPDGSAVWTEQHILPILDDSGWPTAFEGVVFDISERKRMEAALRESEELFHTLAKLSPVGIFRTDAFGQNTYINEHGRAILGLTLEQARGSGWMTALHPDDRERVLAEWDAVRQARLPFRAEYRFRRPDGGVTWVLGEALAEINAAGEFRGYVGTITDITDRKSAEQAVLDAERAKGEAARSAADTERRRLARELHDGALQDLSAVKLLLEAQRKHARNAQLDPAVERLTAIIAELRAVVDNLQPGDLSRASLQDAIAAHAKWITRINDISLTLALAPAIRIAHTGVRDLYRIAQEGLANAVAHGKPSAITVRLTDHAHVLTLEIIDDGAGFDVDAPSSGRGLTNLRERAAALGGDLEIFSAAGVGTTIRVSVPTVESSVTRPTPAGTRVAPRRAPVRATRARAGSRRRLR